MTYDEALQALNRAAYEAVKAARNEDGAPVDAVLKLAWDTDYLVDHGITKAEFERMKALYEGEKRAGLHKPREEYEQDLRDAGRGHLIGR